MFLAMAADSGGARKHLQLEPFIHQVGGHSSMLQLDDSTICKPLIPREMNFYVTALDSLKEFMPDFKGVIQVTFSEDEDGYIDLNAYLPYDHRFHGGKILSSQAEKCETKTKHRIKLCQSGLIRIENTNDPIKLLFEEEIQGPKQNGSQLMNPWVLHCHQEQVRKMRNSPMKLVQEYILLENLTSKYQFPCIMDLKMGTRPYGDDASLAKRQSRTVKLASTTSSSLGIRICGMQVYHHESGHFVCHNKYYGRALSVEGFRQALYSFLKNGMRIHRGIISILLKKLRHLQSVIKSLDTFRFFTSSLLIIYGERKGTMKSSNHPNDAHCPDFGKHNVTLQFFNNGNSSKEVFCDTKEVSNANFDDANLSRQDPIHSEKMNELSSLSVLEEDDLHFLSSVVDIRMIDFAHSTHSQMNDLQNVHLGPDEGYLFGLENLIAELKTFQQESQ